jgi:hypothetical protein
MSVTPLNFPFHLESPRDPGERFQAVANQVRRDIEHQPDSRRRGCVAHVVNSRRRRQLEHAEILVAEFQPELAGEPLELHIGNHKIGLTGRAIGEDRPVDARQDGLHVGLIEAQHDRTIERNTIDELQEGLLNFLERMVLPQMLAVDRRDHRDHRGEQQERAIAFVRLDDHVFALPDAGVRAGMVHAAAHDERRIEPGSGQHRGCHGSGGGLSMRAGDGDAVFQAHQLGEHFGARDHRNFQAVRLGNLDVVRRNGRRYDNDVRAVDVVGCVAFLNRGAQIPQALGNGSRLQIGTRNRVTARKQDFGNAAHAAAPDADQMDPLKIAQRYAHRRTPSITSTMSSTARGRASVLARDSIS